LFLELCVFNQACAHELVIDIFDVLHACNEVEKKKNHVNKNQGWNSSIKSTKQMRTQVDTTQRKIK
jgi:hypothetical protein